MCETKELWVWVILSRTQLYFLLWLPVIVVSDCLLLVLKVIGWRMLEQGRSYLGWVVLIRWLIKKEGSGGWGWYILYLILWNLISRQLRGRRCLDFGQLLLLQQVYQRVQTIHQLILLKCIFVWVGWHCRQWRWCRYHFLFLLSDVSVILCGQSTWTHLSAQLFF